jgi:hypothetical protein
MHRFLPGENTVHETHAMNSIAKDLIQQVTEIMNHVDGQVKMKDLERQAILNRNGILKLNG